MAVEKLDETELTEKQISAPIFTSDSNLDDDPASDVTDDKSGDENKTFSRGTGWQWKLG